MLGCGGCGRGTVPLVVRSAVGGLTTAARDGSRGSEGCQSPSAAICQVPGSACCGYWLLAYICAGQTLGREDTQSLPKQCLGLRIGEIECVVTGRGVSIRLRTTDVWQAQKFQDLQVPFLAFPPVLHRTLLTSEI